MKRIPWIILIIVLAVVPALAMRGTWTTNNFLVKPPMGPSGDPEYNQGFDRVDARLGKEIWVGDPNYGSTLAAAVSAIGSNNVVLRVPAGSHSGNGLTVPANVTLAPMRGALFTGNGTMTVNGGFQGGPELGQIFGFSGGGKVVFGPQSISKIYGEWWGAVADGTTDNRTPMRAALQCLEDRSGGTLKLASRGTYKVTNGAGAGDPGIWISGTAVNILIEGNKAFIDGSTCNGPILKLGEAAESGPGTNKLEGVVVKDLTVTGAGSDAASLAAYPYQDGIYIGNSSRVNIQDVYISNIARNGIAGKKNLVGSRYWNKIALINVKVTSCGNAGLVAGLNNHDDATPSPIDDIVLFNCCFNQLGNAYSQPDGGYTYSQAGVIIRGYSATLLGTEIASTRMKVAAGDTSYDDKVTAGRFAAAGWTYGVGWAQDAVNYEADATAADNTSVEQNLTLMENTTYTVSFAVRNYSAGTVTPYIGAVAGTAVNANNSYCQTITTGATGTLTLKFLAGTGANAFTGSVTDVRVMKSPRGLNTGLYMRTVQALAISGLHCELNGANQLNSTDVYLEECMGAVNGYSTYMADSKTARYGIQAATCKGLTINGANINSALGYSLQNVVVFASDCVNCTALGLSKGISTGSTNPFGEWVSKNDTSGGAYSHFGAGPESGGTYSGNSRLWLNDRYPSLYFRAGTTLKAKVFGDVANGDFYFDAVKDFIWRDNVVGGAGLMTLYHSGVLGVKWLNLTGTYASAPATEGNVRYNPTTHALEFYNGTTSKVVGTADGNITGTAANLSGTPALPDGTAATTQAVGDNTTKLATTAYVQANKATYQPITSSSFTPSDGATYYFAGPGGQTQTAGGYTRDILVSGTINSIEISFNGTAGSNESVTLSLEVYNGSGVLQSSTALTSTLNMSTLPVRYRNAALAVAVTAGWRYEVKMVCPIWVTNPTGVMPSGGILIN